MPRARRSCATTVGTPAARSRSAMRSGSCGAMRHGLGIGKAPPSNQSHRLCRWTAYEATPAGTQSPGRAGGFYRVERLLLLLDMHRVLAEPRAELAQL